RKVRSYRARKHYILLQKSAIQIQAICRDNLLEVSREHAKEFASLRIQTYFRMYHAKKQYRDLLSASIMIQAGLRGLAARKELHFRQQQNCSYYTESLPSLLGTFRIFKAAIATQCAWRGRVARRELRKLKMAAKETGALQAAKNKLEKQVEELTWRLQLEKRMRVDMEEAKTQENEKLQLALREIELQFKEAKDLLMVKEQEAAEFVAERISSIKEIPVIDTTLLDKLTAENVKLKELVTTLETKINETEKEYEETSRLSEERLKKAMEAESKIIELNNSMQRLQDKLANMESENQILRQQALLQLPVKQTSGRLPTPSTPPKHEPHSAPPAVNNYANSDPKMRISYIERQHENVNALINFVVQSSGLTQGKPVAGLTIYKCLLHWKLFEAEKTSVFDRLIQMIGSAIENLESNEHLAYWLSNASALLFLLQKSLKAAGSAGSTPRRKPPPPTSLFGRMTQGFRSSSANLVVDELDIVQHVEAKYPALLFKQQLSAYVEKIYGIIRDNVKKDLTAILSLCIQAPRTAKASMVRGRSFGNSSQGSQWKTIIEHLDNLLMILQENYVPKVLIQKMFSQIFAFINVQLVNSLLLRRECCSFSNGEYVKCGLEELEVWCTQAKQEYAGSSWDELKQIRQAVGFLVIFQKYRISYEDLLSDLCPMLSVQQLYRICTQYWDDKYNTQSVSSSISSSIQEKDFSDVDRPKELLENPAFHFLQ
ncbi:Myosin-8, partial [Ananas comosus]